MANEFKVRKGLVVNGSGSVLLDIQGSQGQLFSVTDQLSGSIFSVSDISGIPVMEAFSDNIIKIGKYGSEAIKVSGSVASVTGSLFGTASQALTASYVLGGGSGVGFPFTGSAQITGSLGVTGSINSTGNITTTGTLTAQTLVVQTVTSSIVFSSGSNIFGSQLTDRQTFTGSMFVTGSGTFTSTISAIGESTLFRGVFNDPVPSTAAVLKMSSTPTPSALSTVVGARMSGSATANFDSYAGYFSNIALSSGTGLSYGIFATASYHTFIGETRLAQGVYNDPVNGTAASVKISVTPVSGTPTAVLTAGATGVASSAQNTYAGYFTNTTTVSGGGVNYGVYATASSHYLGGAVIITNGLSETGSVNITGSLAVTGSIGAALFSSNADSLVITGSLNLSGSFTQAGYQILRTVSQSLNYANDTAAAAGGVPLGGLYRNSNAIQIRLV
jgi:hypothetical protein